jgi:hypothetical protein
MSSTENPNTVTTELAQGAERRGEAAGDVERRILDAVAAIAYGSVEIVIHDGRVVQIERRERIRVDRSRLR